MSSLKSPFYLYGLANSQFYFCLFERMWVHLISLSRQKFVISNASKRGQSGWFDQIIFKHLFHVVFDRL